MTEVTPQTKNNVSSEHNSGAESYFAKRIFREIGVLNGQNTINLFSASGRKFTGNIFSEDRKGNIRILIYTLDRKVIEYDHPKATPEKPNINNNRIQTYYITRYKPENVKGDKKYEIPKGVGVYPFFHPNTIEKFEKKEKIKTLVITEGAFKCFKGAMHGLDIVGLSSITHYRNKKTKELHKDILRLIKTCKVENVIMLSLYHHQLSLFYAQFYSYEESIE